MRRLIFSSSSSLSLLGSWSQWEWYVFSAWYCGKWSTRNTVHATYLHLSNEIWHTTHMHAHAHVHIYTHTRLSVLQMLATSPPFTRKTESKLHTLSLVERMWSFIWYETDIKWCLHLTMHCTCFYFFLSYSVKFSHDSRLRNAAVDVYSALYGRLTPTCLPQGVGLVPRTNSLFLHYVIYVLSISISLCLYTYSKAQVECSSCVFVLLHMLYFS